MKKFSLKAQRVSELSQVIDEISPKDLVNLKDIRLSSNIVKDLQESIKGFVDKAVELRHKQQELLKTEKVRERFLEESKEMDELQKEDFGKKLDADFQVLAADKFKKEIVALEKMSTGVVEIELGDEKFEKLKELFIKHCVDKYRVKDALIEIADALELE